MRLGIHRKRSLPLALVFDECGNYVTATAGRGFPVLLHIGVTALADRRCGSFAAITNSQTNNQLESRRWPEIDTIRSSSLSLLLCRFGVLDRDDDDGRVRCNTYFLPGLLELGPAVGALDHGKGTSAALERTKGV